MGAIMHDQRADRATTFTFIEGPVWIASLGRSFFSDNAVDAQSASSS